MQEAEGARRGTNRVAIHSQNTNAGRAWCSRHQARPRRIVRITYYTIEEMIAGCCDQNFREALKAPVAQLRPRV